MSTTSTVCQGLQCCLEPKARVLMHQLVPSKQTLSFESLNWWNVTPTKSVDESEKVYVHPRSTSSLTTKSLEMCTESLGSETGSLVDSSVDEYSYQKQSSKTIKKVRQRRSSSFPPPLTSISGREGVQVQTHREGGRLVIKAFTYSCCTLHFQAERQNGRLRLSLIKDGGTDPDQDHQQQQNQGRCAMMIGLQVYNFLG